MSWIDSSRSGFGRSIDRSLDLFGKKAHKPTTRTHSTTEQHKHTNKQNELKTKQALVAYSFNQTVVQVGIPCCEYKNKTAQKKRNVPTAPLVLWMAGRFMPFSFALATVDGLVQQSCGHFALQRQESTTKPNPSPLAIVNGGTNRPCL